MAAEVVDLTQDADHGHHQLQLHIPMCPISKPSVLYGPGRGGPRGMVQVLCQYLSQEEDAGVPRSCSGSSNSQGFVTIPRICDNPKEYARGNEDLVLPQKTSQ